MSLSVNTITPCVIIPCYNHGITMPAVLERLSSYHLHCFIVDDGSEADTQHRLEHLAKSTPNVTLIRLAHNQGKGGAVIAGMRAAADSGYSHALQIDADGQHCLEDIPLFLAKAQRYPEHLISGNPMYDVSIPKSRLYGRYITHFWVWVETLSLSIKDSMCGFRVYPLAPTLQLLANKEVGRRMDFDIEIMVRLYWQGTESVFVPTKVIYPENGLSHFDALKDNLSISWMHTRLFFGMLPRIPSLLWRKRLSHNHRHWSDIQERKGLLGMKFMLAIYRWFGRKPFEWLLYPVVGYFWGTGGPQRQASSQYLERLKQTLQHKGMAIPQGLDSYRHYLRFGKAMLDKIASWRGDLKWGKDIEFAQGAEQTLLDGDSGGKLLLVSHLGDIEVCRALAQHAGKQTINALVFTEHAQRFKQIIAEISPQAGINLLPVTDVGADTAIMLKEKIDAGEWVAIVGDRIAVNPSRGNTQRVVWSQFLGHSAPFPQGPFILASVLRCPVLLMFALWQKNQFKIYCEHFANPLELPRKQREQALQQAVDRYASRLEHYALQSPLDWFNFFDFWQLPSARPNKE
ncbi:glycosyltransferase family 2 protein [Xenorhabdus griffiniae]|uniref:Glycosyltransferase n=1 Tax=Xenorhabdus griffiniae TaxID=351672 RepID=A0ABY9XJ80_9GAMM|nr:glycosyltransferase family 2 protein [Xenorhabdus griffiniae]MBD1226760.1 glycosyltransferase family 2 protein [Xenorhabdus griffiniae]MBE8587639.1 glycosyltransferase family 2 protein [Xenorhabdus griffiniae]WMV72980.1 glycosyltransferase [Xenorhabdus griffiniae]WNH02659.1 glycosyltransferase [Xenorhabdus griffiniae]